MHRLELLNLLGDYQTRFAEEAAYVRRTFDFVQQHEDCFHRELAPGHVTGSAWVVNPARDHALLLHHKKHDQWFQPGGHADGDGDVQRVALREISEETGLGPAHIHLLQPGIFDVDIHTIDASSRDPRHQHFDIRFLLEIDDRVPIPGNDESHDIRWVPLHQVARYNNNLSTHRMLEKTRRMR
jgi:8-oxo-dGTP pyrophosphatase MutT (NUDIX family)